MDEHDEEITYILGLVMAVFLAQQFACLAQIERDQRRHKSSPYSC